MIDLENLDDLYIFQEISKGNRNFQILFNRDLARRLYKLELTNKDLRDLKHSFSERGKLGKDPHFYNLIKKGSHRVIYSGLLLDCKYGKATLVLRRYDIENLCLDGNRYIKYQSFGIKQDEQEKMLKGLFLNYIRSVSKFIK